MRDAEQAFEWLDMHLRALGPDVERDAGSRLVKYVREGEVFAVVRPLKTRVDVGFDRASRARHPRVRSGRTGKLPGARYRVELEHPGDLDTEVLAWLEESYMLAAPEAEQKPAIAKEEKTRAES